MKCLNTIAGISDVDFAKNYDLIIVEDSKNEAFLLDTILSRLDEHLVCAWINDPNVLLELIANDKLPYAKLILLDVKMPRMTGIECLQIIRKEYKFSKVPIVMLTSSNHPQDVVSAYKAYCNGYILKDDNIIDFRKKIESVVHYWTVINTLN